MASISSQCLLSEDLVTEILMRLPLKSLLKFVSVCKEWKSIIKSPSFINRHFSHKGNCTHPFVYWCLHGTKLENDQFSTVSAFELFDNETLEKCGEPYLNLPVKLSQLLGPCNGVFCVRTLNNEVALWNPATRKMKPLPSPSKGYKVNVTGFGVDVLTNELKIVYIQGDDPIFYPLDPNYVVYSSSNDSFKWYKDDSLLDSDSHLFQTLSRNMFLNGFCYWQKCNTKTKKTSILAFDMHDEVFEEIEIPDMINCRRDRRKIDLNLTNESLALFYFDDQNLDIWVMKKKGSWTKLLACVVPFKFFSPIGFWSGNKIYLFFRNWSNNELVHYDPDSRNTTKLGVGKSMWFYHYKESLVSLAGNGIPDYDVQSDFIRKFL